MDGVKDSLIDLERHRRRLEKSISELRNALQHWQTWDAEYEALKEEVESAPDASPIGLERIKNQLEGELLNRKEVGEIFGPRCERSTEQIVNILDRRIDYVSKSIGSLQKQLETAENKHAAASVISQPDFEDDDGQPLTEIVEELDEEDNVLSYKLNRPGESLPHVREALSKAGVKDLPTTSGESPSQRVTELSSDDEDLESTPQTVPATHAASKPSAKSRVATKRPPKKGVTFTEDTKSAEDAGPVKSMAATRVENIMKSAKEQEDMIKQKAFVPEDEDPEDAALRQEMLKYSMGEVGAVVAELQLEEGLPGEDGEEWDYSDKSFGDDEDDDGEDQYGRSTGRMVTDDYRQRMLELEQKLGVKSRFSAKEEARDQGEDSGSDDERMGRIVVNRTPQAPSTALQTHSPSTATQGEQANGKPAKKGVRFADALDIAPESSPPAPVIESRQPNVEPYGDVVERSNGPNTAGHKPARKPSRFKNARNDNIQESSIPLGPLDVPAQFVQQDQTEVPAGPDGKTVADRLVERPASSKSMDNDIFEDFMDEGELAEQYQRLRRKFIQRQGGFLKEDESPIQPLDETEGGPERPSRFKAARLSKQ